MKIFFNHCFDKRRFQQFIHWFFKNRKGKSPHFQTIIFLEKLKNLGFSSAMKAGFSISLEDLKIPFSKSSLLLTAEQNIFDNYLTRIERSQAILEIWNRTSDKLKRQVLQSFQISDFLNPVYMMAFSGARGNISQIRQLVALRGLMSDPQGQIIDFPIRSNFREGLTLTEYLICCSGARKGIVDTALRTASSGYLTRRLVDVAHHVVISQIDCGTNQSILLEDLYDQKKKILSLHQRLIGRILAENFTDNTGRIIGHKNQEISKILSEKLCRFHKKIYIRSPLTCHSPQFLCQLCYGWNLAEGQLVSIGEAVGILAAQSIGEPGTQLTMRTFHTGGVFTGILIDQTYSPKSGQAYYPSPCPGLLIRTLRGQIAFLSKNNLVLQIQQKRIFIEGLDFQFNFQPSTLIYAPQGQFVEKGQLLAEGTSEDYSFVENEQNILCSSSGELFFENLLFVEKNVHLIKNKILQNLGEFWILAGEFQRGKILQKRFNKLDLIDKQVPFFQIQIQYPGDPSSCFIEKIGDIFFQTKIQNFPIDFLFFKKIAYFHYTSLNIQTWMAGLHLKSKYKFLKNPSEIYFQKLSIQNFSNPYPKKIIFSREKHFFYYKLKSSYIDSLKKNRGEKTYTYSKYCSFFYENFCIIRLNAQGFFLFNFLLPMLVRKDFCPKVIDKIESISFFQRKSFLSKRFLTTYQYSSNFLIKRTIQRQFVLFHWQKAILINKYHFLILFFKNFSRKPKAHRIPIRPMQEGPVFINPLGYFCFFRIPFLASGFLFSDNISLFEDFNFKGSQLLGFEKFFIQGITNTFLFPKLVKKVKKNKFFLPYIYQTKNIPKLHFNSFLISFTIPLLKIKNTIVHFYFDSFFSILRLHRHRGFRRNFKTGFYLSAPKKPIFYNFDVFIAFERIFYSLCFSAEIQVSKFIGVFPLLDNQKKFQCSLNSICPIQRKRLDNQIFVGCLNQVIISSQLTLTKINIFKQFQGKKIIQRKIFRNPIPQIFIRFFLQIQIGEVVDLISFPPGCFAYEKHHLLFNNFQHLFSYKLDKFQKNVGTPLDLGRLYQRDLFNNKIGGVGQFIARTQKSFLFRRASVYLLNNQSIIHGFHGEIISKNQHICTVFFNQSKTGDIVQGIPKIEQIFEARKKSKYSFREIALSAKNYFEFEKIIFFYLRNLQKSVLNNIQRIYCAQGIHISDKHIEIIVRQITSNVLIIDPGQTGLLPGEIVEFQWISRVRFSSFLICNQILYEPLLMGMTKTCLQTSSFISAASFQETTRILGKAALQNQIDFIRGLKQNVILGNIIPAGTGY
uniref:DNA-directed RNA polymerase n=1 Tax=Caulerpa lentillifera TaxID=148947 RepID=A0A345HGX3_9CHLO|nr:DNA-directed RNA polymerase [Caulerpa lentillifera]AXG75863.1 DNA-directed RNA polymerase [Caulerpa lentillifera]